MTVTTAATESQKVRGRYEEHVPGFGFNVFGNGKAAAAGSAAANTRESTASLHLLLLLVVLKLYNLQN